MIGSRLFLSALPAAVLLLLSLGAAAPAAPDTGELFQIRNFKKTSTEEGPGLLLEFKIRGPGTYDDLTAEVLLFDAKKRRLGGGIKEVYLDDESKFATKQYARNRGTGKAYNVSGYKSGETYTFIYITDKSYSYAVAAVGNSAEKVYAVIPYGQVEEFIQK
jgi:hypothetical protein